MCACVLFIHIYCLPLIVKYICMQFGGRSAELEVSIRFSLQDNREYILDNPNMIRGVCEGDVCIYKMLAYTVLVVCGCSGLLRF